MSTAPIAAASGSNLPVLSLHGHPHRHGVHGDTQNDSTNSTSAASGPSGSTENLFGSLMDSVESIMGLKPAAAGAASNPATHKA